MIIKCHSQKHKPQLILINIFVNYNMSYNLESNAPPSKIIFMNSKDATTYTMFDKNRPLTTDYIFDFNTAIMIPENIDTLVSLESASVPYSFYNIKRNVNDIMDFNIQQNTVILGDTLTGGYTGFIQLPEGNYTINQLYDAIKELLVSEIKDLRQQDVSKDWTSGTLDDVKFFFRYDRVKQKSVLSFDPTVDITNGAILTFLCKTGTHHYRQLYKEIGLELNDIQNFFITDQPLEGSDPIQYIVGTETTGYWEGADYTGLPPLIPTIKIPQYGVMFLSPNAVDVVGISGLYVRTNLTSTGTMDTLSSSYSKILGRIPINVNAGEVIELGGYDNHKTLVNELHTIQTLRIRLTDERNRLIDLNGLHFQISIQLDFVYNKPTIEPLDREGRRKYAHYLDREEHTKGERELLLGGKGHNQNRVADPDILGKPKKIISKNKKK